MTRHIITVGILLASAACGGPTEPSPISPNAPVITVFSGTLPVGGSSVQSLSVSQASNATIMLASLTSGPLGLPIPATVGLALGTPPEGDTTCPRTMNIRVTSSLMPQIRTERTAGTHCVEIYDTGGLTSDVEFAIRTVVTPVTNTTTSFPRAGTDDFSSILAISGSVTRTITASQAGSISATLTTASPPNLLVGMGLGIPRSDGSGCLLNMAISTLTSASALVSGAVDRGDYCVKLFDPGSLPSNVNFTLATSHP